MGNTTTETVRLIDFRVTRLFGEFNHAIPFSYPIRITGLIGPNGIGKTACLKLINALFRMQWSVFANTEFDEVTYFFSDGTKVLVNHVRSPDSVGEVSDALGVVIKTVNSDGVEERWAPRMVEQSPRYGRIEAYLPFLTRMTNNTFVHDHSGQVYSLQEVIENFAEQLPEPLLKSLNVQPPPILANLISGIDCHLIETQRLLVLQPDDGRRRVSKSTLAISRKAQTLIDIIARELAVYASTSQSLDRTFPRRVVQQGQLPSDPRVSENLQVNLAELETLRLGLEDAGILDAEGGDALLTMTNFTDDIASVLSIYEQDTRRKLGVLSTLQSRILLFKELIDNRFRPKSVEVDKTIGFRVVRNIDVDVPLEKLSSGEQHQLVLFFELLFELKKNALILIDEPELSLHVAWQKQFIRDLHRIIDLNEFDVLLATHSPQLIGDWEEIVVELGDVHQ